MDYVTIIVILICPVKT